MRYFYSFFHGGKAPGLLPGRISSRRKPAAENLHEKKASAAAARKNGPASALRRAGLRNRFFICRDPVGPGGVRRRGVCLPVAGILLLRGRERRRRFWESVIL